MTDDLIMVSANVVDTLQKILPVEEHLVHVALKRKIEYSSHSLHARVSGQEQDKAIFWLVPTPQPNFPRL